MSSKPKVVPMPTPRKPSWRKGRGHREVKPKKGKPSSALEAARAWLADLLANGTRTVLKDAERSTVVG